jgi:peptidoglycan/xylan/chitin deacetylase (PgdA/CDA1 family)
MYRKKQFGVMLLAVFFVSFGFGIYASALFKIRPVKETVKSEVKTVPNEIKVKFNVASPSATIRVPILFYHYVEYVQDRKDTIRQSLDIVPRVFEEQIKTLKDAGYTFLTASDLADIMDGIKPIPSKPILITFDDGHWDLATDVLPILEKYQVRVTAYIISGFIGRSDFLSESQLKELLQSKLFEIGSHTVHHVALARQLSIVATSEISQSKRDLEKRYGIKIMSFAYPDGSFDQQAVDTVKKSGYRTAVSTAPGAEQTQSNRYFLYRLRPGGRTGETLLKYLDSNDFKKW